MSFTPTPQNLLPRLQSPGAATNQEPEILDHNPPDPYSKANKKLLETPGNSPKLIPKLSPDMNRE